MFILLSKSLGASLVYTQIVKSVPLWKTVVFGHIPHGTFELSAVFLSLSMGLYVGTYWLRKWKEYNAKYLFKQTALTFCVIIFPLIVIAALIETYVTPLLSLG